MEYNCKYALVEGMVRCRRSGAGRKPGGLEARTALNKVAPEIKIVRDSAAGQAVTAAIVLASVDESGLWRKHLLDQSKGLSR